MSKPKHKIFQIFYDDASKQKLDSGFIPLDNTTNPRPDWYEIWPILEYFNNQGIDEETWYGFLSPRFREKTKYTSKKVYKWMNNLSTQYDVIVLSQPLKSKFRNVFEQGEKTHPGLISTTQSWIDNLGLDISIGDLNTQEERAVFSNYFIAKGHFWKQWAELTSALVVAADKTNSELSRSLRQHTSYRPDSPSVEMKVFIAERIASLLLGVNRNIPAIAKRPIILRKLLPRKLRAFVEPNRH